VLHTRRLVVAISFLAVIAMACGFGIDTDTWWHLRVGQWILDHHSLPNVDLFSFTRAGALWHYPGWLAEVCMAALFQAGGAAALIAMTVACVFLAFLAIYYTLEGDQFLRAFILILAAAASALFWSARPQIFSLLLSAVFFLVLRDFLWKDRNRLWLLPLGMALWVNLHGGFAIGFIFLALGGCGQALTAWMASAEDRKREWKKCLWLAVTAGASVLAVGANPYGFEMLAYPFQTISMHLLQQYIQEWQSPDFHLFQAQAFLWLFIGTFSVIALSGRRMDIREWIFLAGCGYLGFLSARNVELLVVVAPAILARYANLLLRDRIPDWGKPAASASPSRIASFLNAMILGAMALAVGVRWWSQASATAVEARVAQLEPVRAVAWIQAHPLPGNMLNAYNWGAYLMRSEEHTSELQSPLAL
jgi:hypothetical protein